MRVLVLAGTGEARALAQRLSAAGHDVVSSWAGETTPSTLPAGRSRVGGFGGIDGLAAYLRNEQVDRVVDATHPFAATMTGHVVAACRQTGTPLVVLHRVGWHAQPGDRWTRVPDIARAAVVVRASPPGVVLLTTGRRELAAFADDDGHEFVVRTVEPPEAPMPARAVVVLARGPYDLETETELLRRHEVALLVTKDSGGSQTAPKLIAARRLGLPVVVVDRPALPADVQVVADVDSALAWTLSPTGR